MEPIYGTQKEQLFRQACGELAQLINTIRLVSAGGDQGINNAAEDFFCGFLNIVLDCEKHYPGIRLQNMNALQSNYPAVDLADPNLGVAVQVTTTEHRDKINHTLKKFFENNMDHTYKRLIILVIGKKDPTKKAFSIQRNFDFVDSRDIWDIDRLGAVLGDLNENKLKAVVTYFSQSLHTQTSGVRSGESIYYEDMLKALEEIRKRLEVINYSSNNTVIVNQSDHNGGNQGIVALAMVIALAIVAIFAFVLMGNEEKDGKPWETEVKATHEHIWKKATCTLPEMCEVCEETKGTELGHNWEAATCTTPQICKECGETKGEELGHTWEAATCTTPQICKECGETEGEELGHTWKAATTTTPKICEVCGVEEGSVLPTWTEPAQTNPPSPEHTPPGLPSTEPPTQPPAETDPQGRAPTGYSIWLSSSTVVVYQPFYVTVNPNVSDYTQIVIHAVDPQGGVWNFVISGGNSYDLMVTESHLTGTWTFYADVYNAYGTFYGAASGARAYLEARPLEDLLG